MNRWTLLVACTVGVGCSNAVPDPPCHTISGTYPRPSEYGYESKNWACDPYIPPITGDLIFEASSFATLGIFTPGSEAVEVATDVAIPSVGLWNGSSAGISVTYNVAGSGPQATSGNSINEVIVYPGSLTATTLEHVVAGTNLIATTTAPTQIVECDTEIFTEAQDLSGAHNPIEYQRATGTSATAYTLSYVMTHEIGHCLGLEDQIDWDGDGFVEHKGSIMYFEMSMDEDPFVNSNDDDALLYLYGI